MAKDFQQLFSSLEEKPPDKNFYQKFLLLLENKK